MRANAKHRQEYERKEAETVQDSRGERHKQKEKNDLLLAHLLVTDGAGKMTDAPCFVEGTEN